MSASNPLKPAPAKQQVTLCLPGLARAPLSSTTRRLLARADRQAGGAEGLTVRIFSLFGIDSPADADLPVAAVTRVADMGIIDRDWWIRADPVYLEPRRDRLILQPSPGLTADEAGQLVAELNESLKLDGWLLKAPHPDRWYLKPVGEPVIATTPLAEALGHDVHPLLPRGPDRRIWHTKLNELQILLHTASVNAEREKRGSLPANSVWFWGAGRLPRVGQVAWQSVWSNDPLCLGLARLAGIPGHRVPSSPEVVLEGAQDGPVLVDLGGMDSERPVITENGLEQPKTALADLWLATLLAAVHRGELAELSVLSEYGPRYRYRRGHRWRFWRRRLPVDTRLEAA